jgi:hypothetical protein
MSKSKVKATAFKGSDPMRSKFAINRGDPDVDGKIILRGIFRKWEGIVGTGWSGLRIGTGGGHL